jgi:hypothetical protein
MDAIFRENNGTRTMRPNSKRQLLALLLRGISFLFGYLGTSKSTVKTSILITFSSSVICEKECVKS